MVQIKFSNCLLPLQLNIAKFIQTTLSISIKVNKMMYKSIKKSLPLLNVIFLIDFILQIAQSDLSLQFVLKFIQMEYIK